MPCLVLKTELDVDGSEAKDQPLSTATSLLSLWISAQKSNQDLMPREVVVTPPDSLQGCNCEAKGESASGHTTPAGLGGSVGAATWREKPPFHVTISFSKMPRTVGFVGCTSCLLHWYCDPSSRRGKLRGYHTSRANLAEIPKSLVFLYK